MLEQDTYLTLAHPSEGIYKEKGSKFMAFAYPVEDEEQIKDIIASLKKRFYDARHHCYAYILGTQQPYYRANDDGEPNHSAGDPILGQIRSFGLTQVLVVVVRYFGGTKLGVSGLIQAYKTATADALSKASIVEKTIQEKIAFEFDYLQMNEVMKLVKEYELEIISQNFSTIWQLTIAVRKNLQEEIKAKLELLGIEISNQPR